MTFNTSLLADGDVVTVVVKSGSNCSATFNSITFTVVPSPTGTLSVSPSSTICAGDNVTFTATDAGPGATYSFKINGATAAAGSSNTFSTTTLANGDAVTVNVTNSNGCISTFGPVNMTVNPLPTGTLAIAENAGTANDGIILRGNICRFYGSQRFFKL